MRYTMEWLTVSGLNYDSCYARMITACRLGDSPNVTIELQASRRAYSCRCSDHSLELHSFRPTIRT